MSRTLTISLSYDVAHDLEVRAAIDDLNLSDGAALLITEIVTRWRAAR